MIGFEAPGVAGPTRIRSSDNGVMPSARATSCPDGRPSWVERSRFRNESEVLFRIWSRHRFGMNDVRLSKPDAVQISPRFGTTEPKRFKIGVSRCMYSSVLPSM